MAHCAHHRLAAPACAWAETAQPKQRSRSIASRLGNAIRAMKPSASKSAEEKVAASALTEIKELCISKSHRDDDELSTECGDDECISRPSTCGSLSEFGGEWSVLPGAVEEISGPSTTQRKSELDELAMIIADAAQSKFSGRVYQDVRSAFVAADSNGDGKLTQTETLAFCQHFGLSSEVASRLFALLDRHETGLANWSSFLAKYAPIFNKKTDHQLNAGPGRKWPAIQ